MSERTCGECRWWYPEEDEFGLDVDRYGRCRIHHRPVLKNQPVLNFCPAFDDGAFDKAVRELMRTAKYHNTTPVFYDACAAVEKLLKEREEK